jgi:hypothetical protein
MRSVALGLALLLVFAAPASAFFKCKSWTKLDDAGKRELLEQRIDQVLSGNVARQYDVDKVRIRQCLERSIPDMRAHFDGICDEGKRASMQALDEKFDRYVWSCVGQGR